MTMPSRPINGLDHVLVGVRDLDAARAGFARLGLNSSPRGRHIGWGTANYCIMLEEDYIEILGIVEAEEGLRMGVVSMPHGFGDAPDPDNDLRVREIGSNTGRLSPVDRDYDPYSGIPLMSAIPVRVRRHQGPIPD